MKDKGYIAASESVNMLQDHIEKRYRGNIELFCAQTGNDIRNIKAMLDGKRGVSESALGMITKRTMRRKKMVILKLKKHRSYYFTWEEE